MKTSIRTIILATEVLFAATSCQKEAAVYRTQDQVKEGETIPVNINASLGDLVATDGTKATAESVIRLKWAAGDKVQAYCGSKKISGDVDLAVTPSENGLFAKLSGEITTTDLTSGTSVITFVYNNGCTADGLTFDFSCQNKENGIPFVAYATLVYDGTAALTDKMVEFKFATSVMKIAATNLGGGIISNATISGINTKVTLVPSEKKSEDPAVSGNTFGSISTANISAPSDGTKAIITVGLVPDTNKGRNIAIEQSNFINKGVITFAEIKSNTSYTTPASLFPCGTLNSRGYVLIAGTKWATRNVGATADTGTDSYGDYFSWGERTGHTAITKTGSLEILNAFNSRFSSSSYTWKDNPKRLPLENDAANYNWGDPWRMPTSAEFQALKDNTYWKWEDTDKGYYVYAPQSGDAGKLNSDSGVTGTYDKTIAYLLFFPAAGHGSETTLFQAGADGNYWSSTLNSSVTGNAYNLYFKSDKASPQNNYYRYAGFSVRAVLAE